MERPWAKRWRSPLAIALAALIATVAFQGEGNVASGATTTARVGTPAPDFTLRLFDGGSLTLSSLKGKPVVVNFWASG